MNNNSKLCLWYIIRMRNIRFYNNVPEILDFFQPKLLRKPV